MLLFNVKNMLIFDMVLFMFKEFVIFQGLEIVFSYVMILFVLCIKGNCKVCLLLKGFYSKISQIVSFIWLDKFYYYGFNII